jgi:hypothetical protein
MLVCLPITREFKKLPKKIRERIRRVSPYADACWLWIGPRHYFGRACVCLRIADCRCYGRQSFPCDPHDDTSRPKNWLAHRLVYELLVGPIPDGLVLDHLKSRCTSRRCVRPDHLEPVTITENTRRGGGRFGNKQLKKPRRPSLLLEHEVPF